MEVGVVQLGLAVCGGEAEDAPAADVAASFQAAVIDILRDRSRIAMQMFRRKAQIGGLIVIAGVACVVAAFVLG